jgi:hypothetical protein
MIWPVYFALPVVEMLAALALAHARPSMYARLVYVPLFFLLDLGIVFGSSAAALARRPLTWSATERPLITDHR